MVTFSFYIGKVGVSSKTMFGIKQGEIRGDCSLPDLKWQTGVILVAGGSPEEKNQFSVR